MNFYDSLEDVVATSSLFADYDLLEYCNIKFERNDRIKYDNEINNNVCLGIGTMLNNYHNKPKHFY